MMRHRYRRGDIVLVPFPYSDFTTFKQRPALVVSADSYHHSEPDVILAAITGQIPPTIAATDWLVREWRPAGLLMPSVVKSYLVTMEPSLIKHRLGRLSARDLAEVEKRLRMALGL